MSKQSKQTFFSKAGSESPFKSDLLLSKMFCSNSLAEAIERRYQKLINLNLPFPDLILVDGGIGQFNISQKILK
ncbi:hypothetical protein OC716_01860, partial [Candidatus Phytoplasma aurantifolia]|nr:hypothetical protein [Candidatus Phytoplasma aurantifolia]